MNEQKIVLVGGGTAGSVMPLIAIYQKLRTQKQKYTFLFLGTKNGIEKDIALSEDIPFTAIISGKFRRYFDVRNLIDPFKTIAGIFQSLYVLSKYKPEVVLSAGSFVATPVIWAAWLLGIPVIVHQLDIKKGLSNALTAPCATHITVVLEELKNFFPEFKTIWTGNPVRESLLHGDRERAINRFGLRHDLPILLVLGGGTGALELNKIIADSRRELTKFVQIIHITGKDKKVVESEGNYHAYSFLKDDLKYAYAASDVVISRAGMSTISELAVLKKPLILVPLPHSHQLDNASFFEKRNACQVLKQEELSVSTITKAVKKYLVDTEYKRKVTDHLAGLFRSDSLECYIKLIQRTIKENHEE
ncbi:undecaprenyldiphospho-muramoylpentapeptide beta-N-acetylglucosaminyltransferase [Patescibacteria group bacterium]|nr:undecaprenyldiphospho-muramoylpentapeptide beta-N-acetylglucosaminyltransferase [Patescibacteria group bacterium]